MNSIQKQKGFLIGFGVAVCVAAILFLVFGLVLTITGAGNLEQVTGIVRLVFGVLMLLLTAPTLWAGIKYTWLGCAVTATNGSIKQGNIAKEGGTVNMAKCDKCGTELKEGETECSNCGNPVEK